MKFAANKTVFYRNKKLLTDQICAVFKHTVKHI